MMGKTPACCESDHAGLPGSGSCLWSLQAGEQPHLGSPTWDRGTKLCQARAGACSSLHLATLQPKERVNEMPPNIPGNKHRRRKNRGEQQHQTGPPPHPPAPNRPFLKNWQEELPASQMSPRRMQLWLAITPEQEGAAFPSPLAPSESLISTPHSTLNEKAENRERFCFK